MENRANYVLVGIFTVVVLLASFGFVYWTANVSDRDTRTTLLVRIEGSVSGLSQGSQVLFNGLAVGSVTNLRIDPNNPRVVIATTQIDRTTPVTTSTTASLGSQGLTGISFIGLSGGNVNDRNIIASAAEQGAVPVIVANPSDVTDILATARDIAERANNILSQFESIVQAVGPAVLTTAQNVSRTSENVQTFTASLAANADQIDDFLGSLGRLSESANNVALRLPPILDQVGNFVGALDVASVNQSIQNVAAITQAVRDETGDIVAAIDSITSTARSFGGVGQTINDSLPSVQAFLGRLGPLSETATSVASRLDTTLADVKEITAAVDPQQIRRTVDGVSSFAGALDAQSDRVGSVIAGADTALATLNGALSGLNGTRARVDEILAGIDPADVGDAINNVSSATTNIAAAADSVRGVADDIGNRREDINQFITNARDTSANLRVASAQVQGLIRSVDGLVNSPDGQGLTAEARTTLQSIRQTAETIQRSVGPITANIQNFSGQGLQEVRNLIRTTTEAVRRVETAIVDLTNDPSRVLFGGSGSGSGQVREYDGRVRR
ncbi:MlaD family protein [Aureimonas jatrophae]|uniref:Phospholipid/cholesterol/gamma-HCH transport system substrate-binding protein n=1 Tax=Aureimonas jatrophae TaxID=1166073 RepID=A0A1H0GI01_9HYPH|nr:MlaD family protein [Aureimonas jatrophae]MBB3949581.1 phospholipid/cholesterol/gamma-HCH transport system substrate-binding protein [Aureimonas jatrophae]SDO06514.1 phospholipid/cholesterol/gamma-HCH transport system substrate-binding protein [Aureimonas jatrophae]